MILLRKVLANKFIEHSCVTSVILVSLWLSLGRAIFGLAGRDR